MKLMKNNFCNLLLAVLVMTAAACQKEPYSPFTGGEPNVLFTVSSATVGAKADPESQIATGENIDVVYYEVYGTDLTIAPYGKGKIVDNDGDNMFNLELSLVTNQQYNIIFWGQVDGYRHYDVSDLRKVGIVSYSDEKANDETRAAFYKVYTFTPRQNQTLADDVILMRPFSQINIGTSTYKTSFNVGAPLQVDLTQMTIDGVATSFNTLTGEGEGWQSVTFKYAETPNGENDARYKMLKITENDKYYWLGMNYLIVSGESSIVNSRIYVKTNYGTVEHSVENITIETNRRTNIIGDLLVSGATFEIIVDEDFQLPDPDIEHPVIDRP